MKGFKKLGRERIFSVVGEKSLCIFLQVTLHYLWKGTGFKSRDMNTEPWPGWYHSISHLPGSLVLGRLRDSIGFLQKVAFRKVAIWQWTQAWVINRWGAGNIARLDKWDFVSRLTWENCKYCSKICYICSKYTANLHISSVSAWSSWKKRSFSLRPTWQALWHRCKATGSHSQQWEGCPWRATQGLQEMRRSMRKRLEFKWVPKEEKKMKKRKEWVPGTR